MVLNTIKRFPFILIKINNLMNRFRLFALIFLGLSCAAIQRPSGGEKDITPPTIVSTNPQEGQTNFFEKKIELKFSEYLKIGTISKAVQISPALEEEPQFSSNGKNIIISLKDSLKKNQTYIISINRNLSDEHDVKIEESKQIAFSTGSDIDNGTISGHIDSPFEGSLHLWQISEDNYETFYQSSPEYVYDASDNGEYAFKYLSKGDYVVALVNKEMSGKPIYPDKTDYSLSTVPIITLDEKLNYSDINLLMTIKDKPLKLEHVEWINGNWGAIKFSKNIPKDFEVDSSLIFFNESKKLLEYYLFKDPVEKQKMHFYIDDTLESYTVIECKGVYEKNKSILDSSRFRIKVDSFLDTSYAKVISPLNDYILNIDSYKDTTLTIVFSSLIDTLDSKAAVILYEDSLEIPSKINWASPLAIKISPIEKWKEDSKYKIEINRDGIKPKYSKSFEDSVIVINFKTSFFEQFGTLNIFIKNRNNSRYIAELKSLGKDSKKRDPIISSDSLFVIRELVEGAYSLMIYNDKDENRTYSSGSLSPLVPAEWFYIYPDTIQIRSNWELDLDQIDLELD